MIRSIMEWGQIGNYMQCVSACNCQFDMRHTERHPDELNIILYFDKHSRIQLCALNVITLLHIQQQQQNCVFFHSNNSMYVLR